MTNTKDKVIHDIENSFNFDFAPCLHANEPTASECTPASNADVRNTWIFASSPMCSGCVVLSQRKKFNKSTQIRVFLEKLAYIDIAFYGIQSFMSDFKVYIYIYIYISCGMLLYAHEVERDIL